MHNSHVLLFYRWNIWLASKMGRLFHATMLIQWHNEELALASAENSAMAGAPFVGGTGG
jgi:hypothetical protein